jgi:hypothetical protein
MRQLTYDTDKAMAIAGVAYVVQQNTGLRYAAGLWSEILPFNLLWTAPSNPGPRPVRSVPTWSWTSVDRKISNRLSSSGYGYGSGWEEVTPLVANETLLDADGKGGNGLVHNATLRLSGHLCKLDASKINVIFDIGDHLPVEELYCLPILSIKNARVHPMIQSTQIYGMALRDRLDSKNCSDRAEMFRRSPGKANSKDRYERGGYFWTVDRAVVKEISTSQDQKLAIEIV